MTLIVGIKCGDGVVLGADGAVTYGAAGTPTIRQATKKLSIIDNKIVVGVSGSVGLAQLYKAEIEDQWKNRALSGKRVHEVMGLLRQCLWRHAEIEIKVAIQAQQLVGNAAASGSAICNTIVALPLSRQPCLLQFDRQCAPEEVGPNYPFVAIGSGQSIADPFLGFLRRIFWKESTPTLVDGVFAALWTIQHCVELAPGFVADPIQLVVLGKEQNGDFRARELEPNEFHEHREAIRSAESTLAGFRESMNVGTAPLTPPDDGIVG